MTNGSPGAPETIREQSDLLALDTVREERDRLAALVRCAADLAMELSEDETVRSVEGRLAERRASGAAPLDRDALIGRPLSAVIDPMDREALAVVLDRMRRFGGLEQASLALPGTDGSSVRLSLTGHFHSGRRRYYMALHQRRARTGPAGSDGYRDPQSGLLGAESFTHAATERLQALDVRGEAFALTRVEVPALSALMDRLGHRAQRELKAVLGACLRANAVGGDMAGDLGDGSFALLHATEVDIAAMKRRLEDYVRRLDPDHHGVLVGANDALSGLAGLTGSEAALALIHAVKQLEQRTRTADGPAHGHLASELKVMVDDSARRMADVRETIASGGFALALQPVVSLETREVHHHEGLARLDGVQPGGGDSPFDFIRVAEDVGMVREFDLAMVRRVIEAVSHGHGPAADGLPVAVNLSGLSLSTPAFLDSLSALFDGHADQRHRLMIEITETVKLTDFAMTQQFVQDLRRKGHPVCLDDFGAGVMHIDYLRALDVDFVKIDGSYVREGLRSRQDAALLRAIAALCRELGIATIAEMVEMESQVPMLRDAGIALGQGYLFGRPEVAD